MLGRWTQLAIVCFWLASMTWLVTTKVLPPMAAGDPPSYRSLVGGDPQFERPVAWDIAWDDRSIGWARSTKHERPDGAVELRSLVHFNSLPLAEVTPAWLGPLVKLLRGAKGDLVLEARGVLEVDPLGRLIGMHSEIDLGDLPNAVTVDGIVDGALVKMTVRSGDFSYATSAALPSDSMLSDALSPQARMPRLKIGQQWTVPVHSPFRPPNMPLDILRARVISDNEIIVWNGRPVATWLVDYTRDEGAGLGAGGSQGKVWVRHDGTVLKQELAVAHSRLAFIRVPDPPPPAR